MSNPNQVLQAPQTPPNPNQHSLLPLGVAAAGMVAAAAVAGVADYHLIKDELADFNALNTATHHFEHAKNQAVHEDQHPLQQAIDRHIERQASHRADAINSDINKKLIYPGIPLTIGQTALSIAMIRNGRAVRRHTAAKISAAQKP